MTFPTIFRKIITLGGQEKKRTSSQSFLTIVTNQYQVARYVGEYRDVEYGCRRKGDYGGNTGDFFAHNQN